MNPITSINPNDPKGLVCRNCGASLDPAPGEYVQVCAQCGQQHMAETWEPITPDYEGAVLAELSASRKPIKAIRLVRGRSTLGLRQAHDYVYGLAARNSIALAKGGCATLALVTLGALALLVASAASSFAADVGDKKALAEKQGDAAKMERAAAVEVMRSFEPVSPALAVAVTSCRAVKPPVPKEGKEGGVKVSGDGWAGLAGALINAAGAQPSRDEGGDGRVLVTLDVLIKNTGERTHAVSPGDFTLSTPEGYTVAYSVRTFDAGQPLAALYLPPGATTGGALVFALEPFDEYRLNYFNAETGAAGVKKVLVIKGD